MRSHRQLILPEPEIEEIPTYFRHPNTTLIIRLTSLMVQLQDVNVKKIVLLLFKIRYYMYYYVLIFKKMFEFYEFYIYVDSLFEALL